MAEQDQQFVEYVLKAIVDNPNDVKVDRTIDEMGVLISVSVNPDDMGKVIGKSGQTAKAVRTLLKVVGAKNDARVNMKIIEPEGSQGSTQAADDVPVQDQSVSEAVEEQKQTDAAVSQPDDNDEVIDEATGNPEPDEPVTQDTNRKDPLGERSPLDEL